MPLRVVVYIRKSSKDKDENHQKYSLVRQRNDIDSYFDRSRKAENDPRRRLEWKGVLGVDWFKEDASAKKIGRTQFNLMLDEIKKNKFDVLLCTDLSRLSRNALDSGRLVQLLEPHNEKKHTHLRELRTLDKVFYNTPTDKFTLALFFSVAKFENDQRAKNTESGMRRKREDGGTTGKAPVGYMNTGKTKGDKGVEKHPENFDKCRELWEMLLSGEYTLKQIYERKENIGLRHIWNKKNRIVDNGTIRDMFHNRYYTGKLRDFDSETREECWIEGSHPPMVTEEEFRNAQIKLQKLGYTHAPVARHMDTGDLLKEVSIAESGKRVLYENRMRITCFKCGYRFYAPNVQCSQCETKIDQHTKKNSIQRIYFSRDNKKSLPLETVVGWVNAELNKISISDGLYKVLRKKLYTMWLDKEAEYNKERKSLNKRLEELNTERGTLRRKQFDDSLAPKKREELGLAVDSVESELREKENALSEIRENNNEQFELAWQRVQILRDAKEILNGQMEFEPKKNLLLSLVSNLVIHPDRIEVKWHKPFAILAQKQVSHLMVPQKRGIMHHLNEDGSRGRIRTDDPVVTRIPMFPKGVDYIITHSQ